MKKLLKILGIAVAVIVLVAIAFALYINFSKIPYYENEAPDLVVDIDSARINEGARIASMMCIQCHGSTDGKLGGGYMADAGQFGEVYAPNITHHPEFGIPDYTDGELVYLLRTGIKKDGQYAPPWMPKYPHMSDEDIYSLVAFLRSNHPFVESSENNPPEIKPNFFAKFLLTIGAFKPLPFPEDKVTMPDPSDQLAYGRYLATAKFECFGCHSAAFKTVNVMEPELSEGYFGGGNKLYDKELHLILSSNLTMDKETGLGTWDEAGFIHTVKYGLRPDGTPLRYPMVPYPALTDEEVKAIWAYLQSIPVIHNPNDVLEQ